MQINQWGSGTCYPLDVAVGDDTEHIIAQASVTTLELCIQVNVDQLDVGLRDYELWSLAKLNVELMSSGTTGIRQETRKRELIERYF